METTKLVGWCSQRRYILILPNQHRELCNGENGCLVLRTQQGFPAFALFNADELAYSVIACQNKAYFYQMLLLPVSSKTSARR